MAEKRVTQKAAASADSLSYAYNAEAKEKRPYAPCRAACPVNTDIQGYVGFIAQGRYEDAFELIHAVNPISSACSLICHHPCEQACRRNDVDEPLAIRPLKRFALEQAAEYRRNKRKAIPKTQEESIAIIGSGPAGLTAANDLAELGYPVTIFERHPTLGGMLSAAIPPYRLSREALQEDIDDVLSKGVETRTNCEIGTDITLDQLREDHDAVVIAVGLAQSRSLPIPGVEGPGVLLAIPFLNDVSYDRNPVIGEKVLVIGGGNVAVDVARSARRLGSQHVEMVCLENEEEIPAWSWEVEEAEEEKIHIHYRWGPKSVQRDGDRVTGLEVTKVLSVFDEEGRFSPTFDNDQVSVIEADTIIITIGQMSNLSFLEDSGVDVDERGRLLWDRDTQMSSVPGIFTTGEVVTGPGSAIAAASSGHRVAKAIDLYFKGEDIKAGLVTQEKPEIAAFTPELVEKIPTQSRGIIHHVAPEIRCSGFDLFEIGYDEMTALAEARRCRTCTGGAMVDLAKCAGCLTCVRVCPYGAPMVTFRAQVSPDICQVCGLCAGDCPGQAISMVSYDVNEYRAKMADIVGDGKTDESLPVLVGFRCLHNAHGNGDSSLPENIRQIDMHCVSRLDALDILKAFEHGADGAYVMLCDDETAKYQNVSDRVRKRVEYAKQLLSEIGMEGERIRCFDAGQDPEATWEQAAQQMTAKMSELP